MNTEITKTTEKTSFDKDNNTTTATTPKYVCEECGSSDVQYCLRVWYNANTNEIDNEGDDWEDTWCEDCEENCSLIDYEDYQDNCTENND